VLESLTEPVKPPPEVQEKKPDAPARAVDRDVLSDLTGDGESRS
jgi:hypothetical protein